LKPILILDRDGVINEAPILPRRYILRIDELKIDEAVIQLIVQSQDRSWIVCVATNQQAIGKGLLSYYQLNLIHNKINSCIIEAGGSAVEFFVCPHLQEEQCSCRKPMPGLLLQAMSKFSQSVDPQKVVFIGDQESDRKAALSAGIKYLDFKRNINFSQLSRILE
jgi:D-glycero-D-manno-heptose 1,7-bisphosphate phosphatase